MKILFLYLTAFTGAGGIETFNRAFLRAASELSMEKGFGFRAVSLHDKEKNETYIGDDLLRIYRGNKMSFAAAALLEGLKSDLVILGHINLAPIGAVIKSLRKSVRLFLVAHGIDVWSVDSYAGKKVLNIADGILSVSRFTKQRLVETYGLAPSGITVFPDTLDPCFRLPGDFSKSRAVMEKHGVTETDKLLLTVCRLSSKERYKGYDRVIEAMPGLVRAEPGLKYMIIGSGDSGEIGRVKELAAGLGLSERVILTGFVPNHELTDYYGAADVFILPSKGEGFGIVLLEALVCGKPVITGCIDASREVILNGELGLSVDPDDREQIGEAVLSVLTGKVDENLRNPGYLQSRALENFGYGPFKRRLDEFIADRKV